MSAERKSLLCALLLLTCALLVAQVARGQRGNSNNNDEDDFDDAGFDDSGYNQPVQRDTESSNHNPNNYSPSSSEDLDDDDDEVDESHVSPQVAEDSLDRSGRDEDEASEQQPQQPPQHSQRPIHHLEEPRHVAPMPFLDHVQTQNFYAPPNPMLVANLHPAANYAPFNYNGMHMRYRRSVDQRKPAPEGDIEDIGGQESKQQSLLRRKRHAKGHKSYIGPVYTYVKTDKHANFKWGVKHKVGKHYG